MSGFDVYKFNAVDRPLTNAERKEVGSWSSRSSVSATSATFTYSYGSFPRTPEHVLESYFDGYMFFSSYGIRQVMFKLPADLVDYSALMDYQIEANSDYETYLRVRKKESVVLLDFCLGIEDGGWLEEDDYSLSDIMSLRNDIINGDYSALYAYWLSLTETKSNWETDEDLEDELEDFYEDYDDDEEAERAISAYLLKKSPPVPVHLQSINGALSTFMEFLEIDNFLIKAAAALNQGNQQNEQPKDYHQLISELSASEKDDYLKRLLKGEPRLALQLKKHLDSFTPSAKPSVVKFPLDMILEKRTELVLTANRAAQIKAEKKHRQKMEKMAKEEETHWDFVYKNLGLKQGHAYDKATKTLTDLKSLAIFKDDLPTFKSKMDFIVERYGRSQALMRRLKKAGIVKN